MAHPASFSAVVAHLEQVRADPSTVLDVRLLETLQAQLTEPVAGEVAATLLALIPAVLAVVRQDPTPVTVLGSRAAASLSFSDLCGGPAGAAAAAAAATAAASTAAASGGVDFVAGLRAASPPINLFALSLLGKAGALPSDAAIVASDSELVASLVELWLSTSSGEVAQAALDVIWALLEVDLAGGDDWHGKEAQEGSEDKKEEGRHGLMWRRVFTDREVYGRMFALCDLDARDARFAAVSKRQRTLAQGRLMAFLTRAGRLRWDMITTSQVPDIEATYCGGGGGGGGGGSSSNNNNNLLYYATCRMVDCSDVLLHLTLLCFLRDLLEIDAPGLIARPCVYSATTFSSRALDFLESQQLHAAVLGYYVDEATTLDPLDARFLAGPVVAYVARYAELYPNHFLRHAPGAVVDGILRRIGQSMRIPSAAWAAPASVPGGELHLLSSLPRVLLVKSCILAALPSRPPCAAVYLALAKIFHGPARPADESSMELDSSGHLPTDWPTEAAAARALYLQYVSGNPAFWQDVTAAADVVALKDTALAAIGLIKAIVTANWGPDSPAALPALPAQPAQPAWAALTPPALTTLVPYLMRPPRSSAEFVGGGAGDVESAVSKVASAKYEVLVALHRRLQQQAGPDGLDDIVRALGRRVRQGVWGSNATAADTLAVGR